MPPRLSFRQVMLLPGLVALLTLTPLTAHAGGVICPGPNTVEGIDISSWQGTIDWAKVKASKQYAIIRVSDGTYQDPKFAANWAAAKKVGIIHGIYQFFEPAVDPILQADQMLAKMGPMTAGMLPPMLDVEATGKQSPAVIEAHIATWVAHVKQKTGKDPIVYTGKYFWEGNVKSSAQKNLPLAHAQYCSNCCPNIAAPWSDWAIWQYTSSGKVSGIGGNVDLDKWKGTLATLQKFTGQGGCTPHCEGTNLVDKACGKGDCAKYAAKCVDDDLAPRCVSNFCPAKGTTTVCVPDPKNSKLGTCKNGALTTGECSAFGALCSTAGGQAAHCASAFCVKTPKEVPVEHDVCLPDGKRYHCDKAGVAKLNACPATAKCEMTGASAICKALCKPHCEGSKFVGTDCKPLDCATAAGTCVDDDLGARCKANACPAKGEAVACMPDAQHSKIGACKNGALSVTGECSAYGAWCSTAFTPNQCVSAFCAAAPDVKPVAKDVCLPGGKRYACDDKGGIGEKPCPAGQSCVADGKGGATCGNQCKAHCEGATMVDAACGKNDCAAAGGVCIDDDLGVRCKANACPAKGNATTCLDAATVGLCSNGIVNKTPCGAEQVCIAPTGSAAHCADKGCLQSGKDAPEVHDICLAGGGRGHCDDTGAMTPQPCEASEVCVADGSSAKCQTKTCQAACTGSVALSADCSQTDCAVQGGACVADEVGVRCVDPACPAQGLAQVCLGDKGPAMLGACDDGALKVVDCSGGAADGGVGVPAWCSTSASGADCVAKVCVDGPSDDLVEHDVCTAQGRVHCSATGEVSANPCTDGTCNACGGCGPTPIEVCNGLDDDCNGEIDDVPGTSCDGSVADGGGTAQAGDATDGSGGDAKTGLDGSLFGGDVKVGNSLASKPASGCSAGGAGSGGGMGMLWLLGVGLIAVGVRRRRGNSLPAVLG
jgi:MYXO-CTERM domain-containing protein